jgi:2-C-methyl-D-erythritol 4-phosphate cytidylyltransferase
MLAPVINQYTKVCAIIVAAGKSRRMNGQDKIFAPLSGKPVLAWAGDTFQTCPAVSRIVLVLSEENMERGRQLARERGWSKVTEVVAGGIRRQDSVAAGLQYVKDCGWVIIHDGARPFITCELITQGLAAAGETGAAIAAVQVTDTIKSIKDDRIVEKTLPRQNLWRAQTPQIFRSDIISRAYREIKSEATDDASLVEQLGIRVKIFPGSYGNIKITTPADLALAQALSGEQGGDK